MAHTNKNCIDKYCKSNENISKIDIHILKILHQNKEGLRVNTLHKLLGISRRTLYYRLNKLKKAKLIQNMYPIWKLCNVKASSSKIAQLLESKEPIQGHKFSFVLRLIHKPDWWEKKENKLMRLKDYNFKPVDWGNYRYSRISKDNHLIQFFSNTIVFINQKQYYGRDSYDCFIEALEDTLQIYNFIEEMFRYKFFKEGIPQFSVRSHHYIKLDDEIAKRCKKSGNMLKVEIKGKLRAWVDLSQPFGLETGHKDYAVEDNKRYADFIGDILDKDPPKSSELAKHIKETNILLNDIVENIGNQICEAQKQITIITNVQLNTQKQLEAMVGLFTHNMGINLPKPKDSRITDYFG